MLRKLVMLLYGLLVLLCAAMAAAAWSGGTKTWGSALDDMAQAVATDSAGNVYVTGYFNGTVDFDTGGGVDYHVAIAKRDVFLCKLTAGGSFVWARTWGGNGDDTGNGIAVDSAGNVWVAGRFQDSADFDPGLGTDTHVAGGASGNNDAFVCKYDTNGNFQWARSWGGIYGDEAYGVAVDKSDNAYVVGDFSSLTVDFNPGAGVDNHDMKGMFDAFISKFDSNGNFVWANTWGGDVYDDGPRVTIDGSGNIYVCGMFSSTNADFDPGSGTDIHATHGSIDVFLTKFTSNGAFLWARTWGGTGDDCGDCVHIGAGDTVYVTGYFTGAVDFDPGTGTDTHTANGDRDCFLSRFDANGNFQWAKTWGGSGDDRAETIDIDNAGNIYDCGLFNGTVDFDPGNGVESHPPNGGNDVFVSKFDANGNYLWARTCGGTGDDAAIGEALIGGSAVALVGWFSGTVYFNPWGLADIRTAVGAKDGFLAVLPLVLPTYQADLWLRTATETGYTGDNVYSADGTDETKSQTVAAGKPVSYLFKVQNDGNTADAFTLTGTAGGSGWTAKYYTMVGAVQADITAQITGGVWSTANLPKGGSTQLWVSITPNAAMPAGSSKILLLTATSNHSFTKKDVVKMVTTIPQPVRSYQPDLHLRTAAETAYTGDNMYNLDGAVQTKTQTCAAGKTALYYFHVQNDGNTADNITVIGPAGGNGWTVRYYEMSTNVEITTQMTGGGYATGIMAARGFKGLYVRVTPASAVAIGATFSVTLTAVSSGDAAKQDVVVATTTRTAA